MFPNPQLEGETSVLDTLPEVENYCGQEGIAQRQQTATASTLKLKHRNTATKQMKGEQF